jgi:hypothetical protein
MRQRLSLFHRSAGVCLLVAGLCGQLSAATVSKLNDDVLAPLREVAGAKQIRINNMPLYAHGTVKIELEEFEVWAPGGKVVVHNGTSVQYLDPPPMRFFRGQVNGDPESFAYFSVDGTTGAIQGLIATRDGKFAVGGSRRNPAARDRIGGARTDPRNDFDYFLAASDASDAIPMTGQSWSCGVEKLPVLRRTYERLTVKADTSGLPLIAQGISGTQSRAMIVEVETDDELYAAAGNSTSAVTALATNLTGAVSTIYNRDLNTNVLQQNVHVYAGPLPDSWTATDEFQGLAELGNSYHTNHLSLKRSAVIMLSGKTTQSGVAWEGTIGSGDSPDSINGMNTYSGAYAWCGSIGDFQGMFTSTVPDPNATTNGTLYGMPSGGNNYWPLEEYAHELGHNLAGHHTHCVAITDTERGAAGFTDGSPSNSSSNFIDHCDATAGSRGEVGCYGGGTNYVAGSQGTFKGTIMSYCHNVFITGVPQSRFTFGQGSEPSHHELDDYMLRAAGPGANGGPFNIVNAVGTMTMSTISGSSSVAANSTGNTATVSTTNGGTPTFSWTITGGTITAGATSTTVTYTAGASGSVVLRATAYKNGTNFSGFPDGGVGISDTKTVTITSVLPPTNVVATATGTNSVQITWTAAAGATKYQISRSSDNITFTAVCVVATTCPTSSPFTDGTAAANAAYIYKVKSVDAGSNLSSFSTGDLATTVIFTDATLTQQSTKLKAAHITELRTAVNAVCTLASNPSPCSTAFTDLTLTAQSTKAKAAHVNELRAKLNAARSSLVLTAQTYTDPPTVTAQSTLIKAAHINELRNGVK